MENIQNNLKHNMTRIRSLLAIIVLAIMMITMSVNRYTVLADNDEVTNDSSDTTGADNNEAAKSTEKKYVDDAAELIPDGEEAQLVEKCKELSDECKVDIGIATTTDAKGLSSKEYAQESVLNNNLGYEDDDRFDKSAVLFLIDLDERNHDTYIVTEGLGILLIEDDDIENILDDVYAYIDSDLSLTDFYMVCDAFLNSVSDTMLDNYNEYGYDYIDAWEKFDGTYAEFDKKYVNVEHGPFYILRNPIPCLMIALIVAGVAVAFMSYSNKAKMTVTGNTYMDKNEFKMHICSDRYINTTTTKVKRSSDSSSGGGGSHGGSHSSGSGGHSFGGGGRSL